MPIVGTAGHVDHGKSTLVLALTGRDPDRWEEEKRRGLTIDLGFAWATLPTAGDTPGVEVAFVDVPGHERFIRNMLAGIEAIDVALLVVAADEGWMPQSEEHLAVLDLLGVRHGVVALTKADRVDEELLELAAAEVEEHLGGTSLDGSPVIPTVAPTGAGVGEIRSALARAVAAAPAPADLDRPRLWIDRSFSVSGVGTVVTGTLLGGSLHVGDPVAVWPGELESRARNLQSHERDQTEVGPGNRVAVNLAGLDRHELSRGDMLGRPGQWSTTRRVLVDLRLARYVEQPLTRRGAYHLHLGSGSWPVRLRMVDGEAIEREGAALMSLPEALPLQMGDRFILREVGRRLVVGGGRVLDPGPPPRTATARSSLAVLRPVLDASPDRRAEALLTVRGRSSGRRLASQSGGGNATGALAAGETVLSSAEVERLGDRAARLVDEYHRANPLRPGMPKASLASRLGVSVELLESLIGADGRLRGEGAAVARKDFRSSLAPDQEQAWEAARSDLAEAGLAVPRLDELGLDEELIHALVRDGRLVRIAGDLGYLPEQISEVQRLLAELPGEFTVAQFRDALDITRRYAVPLLEWLDGAGVTVRDGDLRRLRRRGPARR